MVGDKIHMKIGFYGREYLECKITPFVCCCIHSFFIHNISLFTIPPCYRTSPSLPILYGPLSLYNINNYYTINGERLIV